MYSVTSPWLQCVPCSGPQIQINIAETPMHVKSGVKNMSLAPSAICTPPPDRKGSTDTFSVEKRGWYATSHAYCANS